MALSCTLVFPPLRKSPTIVCRGRYDVSQAQIKELSGSVSLFFHHLLLSPVFICEKNMSEKTTTFLSPVCMYLINMNEKITTLLGTISSWLGSITAQVIGHIVAFYYKRATCQFPSLSPAPHPLESGFDSLFFLRFSYIEEKRAKRSLH